MRSATLGSPMRSRPALRRISSRSPPINSGQISPRSSPSLSGTSSPGIFSPGLSSPLLLGDLAVVGGREQMDGAPAALLTTVPPKDGPLGRSVLPSDTPPPSPPSEQISPLLVELDELDQPAPLPFTPISTPPAAGGAAPPAPSIVYEDALQPAVPARPLTPGSKMKTSMSFHSAEQVSSKQW